VVPSTLPLEDEDRQPKDIDDSARSSEIPAPRMFPRSTVPRGSSVYSYYTGERSDSLRNGKSTSCSGLRSFFGSWKENHLEEIYESDSKPREKVEMIPERRRQTYVFDVPPVPTGAPQAKTQNGKVQEHKAKRKGKTYPEVCTCPSVCPILISSIKQISGTNKLKSSYDCDEAFTARILQDKA